VIPMDTPLDNIWLAEAIGAFPDPARDWRLYWELISSPPIPSIYRLRGPHEWSGARAHFDSVKAKLFVKLEDPDESALADAMLAELGPEVLRDLAVRGEIGAAQRDRVIRLLPQLAEGGMA
ncbi:MAG: hypothetical protein O3A96_12800, partial [Proteobacteria bacterium]|nr:hypothetical protein [Pseudomonadota bacterium]